MTTLQVFEKAASRKLSPEAAAQEMLDQERRARESRRPQWLPRWAWAAGGAVCVALLSFINGRSHN
jgi:hypothetical protein